VSLDFNPTAGIRKNEEFARDRLVEDSELSSFVSFARGKGGTSAKMALVAEISAITAKAQGQLLKMTKAQITPEGLAFTRRLGGTRKRGRSTVVLWSPRLRALIDEALALKETKNSLYVFPNRDGAPYSASVFKSMWNILMHSWIDAARPKLPDGTPDRSKASARERFTFHDLRALAISRVKAAGREAAPLSGHTSERMADRVYDRRRVVRAEPVE
jgi:integrase